MKALKSQYHHGDLRATLVEAAVRLLETEGIDALSIRRLAELTGVSRAAPYHHFQDKRELLCAIAEAGFLQQEATLTALEDLQGRKRIEQFVHTYVSFATQHREQYDLMYGREIWKNSGATTSLEAVAKQCFKRWLSEVTALQAQSILNSSLPAVRVAQVSWAALHGLCRLINDGIYADNADIEAMEASLVAMLVS